MSDIMQSALILFLIFAVLFAIIAVLWRLGSRRQSLPCPVWLRWLVELDNPFTRTNRAAFIIENLQLEEGMTILDAGCGPGRLTIPIAEKIGSKGRVIAMDIQEGMLARTKIKAEAAGLKNIEYLHAGLGTGQLGQNRFDKALMVTVLGEIPDQKKGILELFDSLNPGGILSITEVIFDPHFQTRSNVLSLAVEVGFTEAAFFGNKIAYVLHLQKPH